MLPKEGKAEKMLALPAEERHMEVQSQCKQRC